MQPARALFAAAGLLLTAGVTHAVVPVVELDGVVHAVSAGHVVRAIEQADAAGAPLLILRVDTPGGLDSAMRQIVDKLLNCRTPVVVFVGPSGARAASAGFVVLIAADLAAMAPGTNIGAAHPVSAMGQMDETMSKKVTSDAAAYIRGKAERRGRNVALAEKAVMESQSFTEKEALDGKLIDLVVQDVPALLKALDGREVRRFDGTTLTLHLARETTTTVAMKWPQHVLAAIAHPEFMFLLLLGALAGIGAEISHPGALFPGILGVLCLILFLFATQIIPVNAAGVLLILLAVVLFAVEVKVPSYGLLTAGGIVAMVLGALMLVDAPIAEMRVGWATLIPAAIAMAVGVTTLLRLVLQAQRRVATTGVAGMIGQFGIAETTFAERQELPPARDGGAATSDVAPQLDKLAERRDSLPARSGGSGGCDAAPRSSMRTERRDSLPARSGGSGGCDAAPRSSTGSVRVDGERWRAVADETVTAGQRIQVIAVDGLTLRVRRRA